MLETHVLERKKVTGLDASAQPLDITLLKFEAIRAVTRSSRDINEFVHGTRDGDIAAYFRDHRVADLWQAYNSINPNSQWTDPDIDATERSRFVKTPFYAAVEHRINVLGGIWVDVIRNKYDRTRCALLHIFVKPGYGKGGIGSTLLEFFEENAAGRFDSIMCGWGPRDHDGAAKLFERQGYLVETGPGNSGSAYKDIRKVLTIASPNVQAPVIMSSRPTVLAGSWP